MRLTPIQKLVKQASTVAGSDSALARKLSINRTAVRLWHTGNQMPSLVHHVAMAELIGMERAVALEMAYQARRLKTSRGKC